MSISSSSGPRQRGIVPPYLLKAISESPHVGESEKKAAKHTLDLNQNIIEKREQVPAAAKNQSSQDAVRDETGAPPGHQPERHSASDKE